MGQEAFPVGESGLGGLPSGPRVVGRPSWRTQSGQEALPESRELSEGLPGGPAVVRSPSRWSGCGL